MSKVLIVEDERMVAEVVEQYLRRDGHTVRVSHSGADALAKQAIFDPDLIVLDVMLPGLDGFEVCRRVRSESQIPIIIVSARREEYDRLRGLGLGADDYVTKPFSPRELAARVQAVLRRTRPANEASSALIQAGALTIDPAQRLVSINDKTVDLTAREFNLLYFLASHPRQVFTRDHLLQSVWGTDFEGDERTVTVHIRRVREKLERSPRSPRHIQTAWGVGYRFVP